ncbi:hypothetical protein [Lysinibacillus sp. NPDC092081]|uniref:hypothetical protein n=1 Tax=Lysinibacillus sp. NPDC092081 TaxID=3364131 RepID=UPI00380C1646
MIRQVKYSYYDNGVYILSKEEIADLKPVEISQNFLSEYEYFVTRHIICEDQENIWQVLYSEIRDLPEVKETIMEAKDNGFHDVIIYIKTHTLTYTVFEIFIHKLHKLKFVNEILQIIKARKIS